MQHRRDQPRAPLQARLDDERLEQGLREGRLNEWEVRLLRGLREHGSLAALRRALRPEGRAARGEGERSLRRTVQEALARLEGAPAGAGGRVAAGELEGALAAGYLTERQAQALRELSATPTRAAAARSLGLSRAALLELERRGRKGLEAYRKVQSTPALQGLPPGEAQALLRAWPRLTGQLLRALKDRADEDCVEQVRRAVR